MTRHDKSFLFFPIHLQPLVSGLLVFAAMTKKTLPDNNRICQQISLSLFSAILSVSLSTQNKRAVYTDALDSSLCLNLIRCLESVCSPCTGVWSSSSLSLSLLTGCLGQINSNLCGTWRMCVQFCRKTLYTNYAPFTICSTGFKKQLFDKISTILALKTILHTICLYD